MQLLPATEPRLDPRLLTLLCDQGKFAEASALVDRYAARVTYEIEQATRARAT